MAVGLLVVVIVLLCVVGRRLWNQANDRDEWHPEDWE